MHSGCGLPQEFGTYAKTRTMDVTVVVPTFNMAPHLGTLWQSFVDCGLVARAKEILVVNDGSTDETRALLDALALREPKLRALHLEENVGRFRARLAGAQSAASESVLFLDTRVTLPKDFAEAVERLAPTFRSIVGAVDIDTSRSAFCLYWDRSHRFLFRNHYKHAGAPIELRPDNFDDFLKGTTVFLCPRDVFLRACAAFTPEDVLNDDMFLMRRIVEEQPITVHPEVRIGWVPRETLGAFLGRMWERGPQFTEYHVFEKRGAFFYATLAGAVGLVGTGVLLVVAPPVGGGVVLVIVLGAAASTALFSKTPSDFVRLLPIHMATIGTFGAGVVYGLGVNLLRKARGQWPTVARAT